MCGRYSLTSTIDQLLPRLKGPLPDGLLKHYQPRQQVRPGEPLLIQRQQHGRPEVSFAQWGLVPGWLKDTHGKSRPINARSETVSQKPFFRGPWRHHRCLLPADGFYEWHQKQPYWIRRQDGAAFWLGGLWDHWIAPDGTELQTCCILTTTPNALLRPIHDRMPVVIMDGWEEAWLLPEDAAELRGLEALMAPWNPAGWEAIPLDRL
ncbi:SOS response-associated peptidase [Synechococcus sp. 1G10]|uniref:SOS response-associated peptidase n=1 Tax=Synechococcus sp. 1G10 TaxID=2025605 RepID=UPI000B994B91|nr:SOS response-associated peptidase [Synechococcus sp. 1G10]